MSKTQWAEADLIPEVMPQTNNARGNEPQEKPPSPPPRVLAIGELEMPPGNDPNELLRHRYLCRGGGLLIVGPTGIGKSTFMMQAALCFAVGREFFGIVPTRPLKSLIIQAENDFGDLAEMRDGILAGLEFSEEERILACRNVLVANEDMRSGAAFCAEVLAPLLMAHQPDLLWVDPALAYLGGEANAQRDVGEFLRNGINPLVHKHGCAVVVVHHTNKPPSGSEKPDWQGSDFAYLGSGSSEWANWPRAVLALRSIGSNQIFELKAGKRGSRLGWQDANGERCYAKLIAHAKDGGFHWREVTQDELEEERGTESETRLRRYKPSLDEFMGVFPQTFAENPREALLSADQIKNLFHERGWHKDFYRGMCDEAEACGRIATVRGEGRGGQVLRGLPVVADAFKTLRQERGSLMEDVPLAAPLNARRRRK